MEQYAQTRAALDSQSGKLECVEHVATEPRKSNSSKRKVAPTAVHELEHLRKRSATPISMSDAAELSSFHRRNTRPLASTKSSKSHSRRIQQKTGLVKTPSESDVEDDAVPSSTQDTPDFSACQPSQRRSVSQDLDLNTKIPNSAQKVSASDQEYRDLSIIIDSSADDSDAVGSGDQGTLRAVQTGMGLHSNVDPVSLPSPRLSPVTRAAPPFRSATELGYHIASRKSSGLTSPPSRNARFTKDRVATADGQSSSQYVPANATSPEASTGDIPSMLDSFDLFPDEMKSYVMYQFLRRCSKATIHLVADIIDPALRCDFVARLPLELSLNVLQHLDAKTLCRAAQVSRKWRQIVDSNERAWRDLLDRDGYVLPSGEINRAIKEGWGWQYPGWQYPHCLQDFERDISHHSARPSNSYACDPLKRQRRSLSLPPTGKKRKNQAKGSNQSKKQKRKEMPVGSTHAPFSSRTLDNGQGPVAQAGAAAAAIPDPRVGLPSLRNLHLFKTLYQRHYMIRKSWMQPEYKPLHLAFRAHQRHVVTCLQFDSDKILTGSDDSNIDVYETKTGASVRRLQGHEGGVWALEYQDDLLVSGSTDRTVRVWNLQDGSMLHVFQGHTSTVRCLQILKPAKVGVTRDGRPVMMPRCPLIITGSRDSTCRVWRLPQMGDPSVIQLGPVANDHENPYFVKVLQGHTNSVRAIAAYADTLVSGSYDSVVRVWKVSTGECLHRLQGHNSKVYSVVLDYPRGRCISGSMDNSVKIWSLETGSCLFNLDGHTSLVGLLDLRDDYLVSAAADATLRVWDPENGRCHNVLSAHTGAITCFLHDGQKIISGSDRTLKMWDTRTGDCVRDLLTDLSGVWQIKFDERRCIAAVQRDDWTYIEARQCLMAILNGSVTDMKQVLDFGAGRDGVDVRNRGRRIVVDHRGQEIDELEYGFMPYDPIEIDT